MRGTVRVWSGAALFALLLTPALPARATAPLASVPLAASAEIDHLLVFLAGSGCEFYRNGTWYPPAAARAHLETKYEYFVKRDLVRTAEDFIRLAATESSMSHMPYQVRCGGEEQPSAVWFGTELQRFRQKTGAKGR